MNKHAASGYSLFTHCSFDTTKKKHYLSGEDCRKNFCKDLRVHATEIINYEKKRKFRDYNDNDKKYYCH